MALTDAQAKIIAENRKKKETEQTLAAAAAAKVLSTVATPKAPSTYLDQRVPGGLKTPLDYLKETAANKVTTQDRISAAKASGAVRGDYQRQWQKNKATTAERIAERRERDSKQTLSEYDSKLPRTAQDRIRSYKTQWGLSRKAGDTEGVKTAHALAEQVRAREGYSGGVTGDDYLTADLTDQEKLLLNPVGQNKMKMAKLAQKQAFEAKDAKALQEATEEMARIMSVPGYRNQAAVGDTDAHGRSKMPGSPDAQKDAEQALAILKAAGYGTAGAFAALMESSRKVLNSRDPWGVKAAKDKALENLADYDLMDSDDPQKQQWGRELAGYRKQKEQEELQTWMDDLNAKRLEYQGESYASGLITWEDYQQRREELLRETMTDAQWLMYQSQKNLAKAAEGQSMAGQFGTNTLVSGLQQLPGMAAALIPVVGPAVSLAYLGAMAAGQKAHELDQRGIEPGEVFTRSFLSAGVEVLTEKIPLGAMLDIVKKGGGENFLKALGKTLGLNFTEESLAYTGNWLLDKAYEDPEAKFSLAEMAANGLAGALIGGTASVGGAAVMGGGTREVTTPQSASQTAPLAQGSHSVLPQEEAEKKTVLPTAEEVERQQRAAQANTELERSGILAGAEEETIRRVGDLAGKLNREVRFFRGESWENGRYDPNTGILHLNTNGRNPIMQVFAHELTHSIETAESYDKLAGAILKTMDDTELNERFLEITQRYQEEGVFLEDPTEVMNEVVAEYVETRLLTDYEAISSLVQTDRSLGQRILEWIDSMLAKLGSTAAQERAALTEARELYARALQETNKGGATMVPPQPLSSGVPRAPQKEASEPSRAARMDRSGWVEPREGLLARAGLAEVGGKPGVGNRRGVTGAHAQTEGTIPQSASQTAPFAQGSLLEESASQGEKGWEDLLHDPYMEALGGQLRAGEISEEEFDRLFDEYYHDGSEVFDYDTEETPMKYSISPEEIQAVQSIDRKSISEFTAEELEKTASFAERYWLEMGVKSPFFRAKHGDWRASDQTPVQVAYEAGDTRGAQINLDTGWEIAVSGKVFNETKAHHFASNRAAWPYLPYINDIVKKAVLLDSSSMGEKKVKSGNSLMMHSLYAVADRGEGPEVVKLYVEEMNDPNRTGTAKRAYQLQNIENQQLSAKGSGVSTLAQSVSAADIHTVADLFAAVKGRDKHFGKKAQYSIARMEDGSKKESSLTAASGRDAVSAIQEDSSGPRIPSDWEKVKHSISGEGESQEDLGAERAKKVAEQNEREAKLFFVKTAAKHQLTPEEKAQVEQLMRGELKTDDLTENRESIEAVYKALNAYEESRLIYNQLVKQYKAIKPGEKPYREVDVPKSTDGKDRVGKTVRTFMEAQATTDELVSLFRDGVLNKEFSYTPKQDKKALTAALHTIEKQGWEGAWDQWQQVVQEQRPATKEDIITAQLLYKAAAQAGDLDMATQMAKEMAPVLTQAGQTIQAMRMLKKQTPDGKLYYAEKMAEHISQELREKKSKKTGMKGILSGEDQQFEGVSIPEDLKKALLKAETEQQQYDALDNIYKAVGAQIPPELTDRLNAWRYFAMLGNPRTHIRNVLGNLINKGLLGTRNKASAVGQLKLPRGDRTRTLQTNRAYKEWAKRDFEGHRYMLKGNKYSNDLSGVREYMKPLEISLQKQEAKPVLKTVNKPLRLLQKAADFNSDWLDKEDFAFKRSAYINSLANFLTARGIDPETATEEQLEEARGHAINDALEATFQQYSQLANELSRLERSGKAMGVVVGSLVPFKKTPINIAKQGGRFTPIGIAEGLWNLTHSVKNGDRTATEAIDHLCNGLSGTAIGVVGAVIAAGILEGVTIIGSDDEDKKQRDFDMAQGSQEYSLVIGNHSYTIDWAAPAVIPILLGAEVYHTLTKERAEDESVVADTISAAGRLMEPLINLTMLSGVSGTIQAAAYGTANPFVTLGGEMVQNYAGQFLPTLLGQVARTVDDTRRTTYYDHNSNVPKGIQSFLQRQGNKIPGVSQKQLPWMDAWGRTEQTQNGMLRVFENFISPGYLSRFEHSAVDKELQRLHDLDLTTASMLPSKAAADTKVNGKFLDADKYAKLVQTQGRTARNILEELFSSDSYRGLSDLEKSKAVEKVYEFAKEKGKIAAGQSWDGESVESWMRNAETAREEHNIPYSTYVSLYVTKNAIDSDESLDKETKALMVASEIDRHSELSPTQIQFLKDNIAVFQMNRVEAKNYERGREAGLDIETSSALQREIDALEPLEGATQVSAAQKYRVVVDAGISEDKQMEVLGSMMQEAEYTRLQVGRQHGGVVPAEYVQFLELKPLYDEDGNGSYKQAEVTALLKAMNISNNSKAALWQMANKSWKPWNNPFNVAVSTKVYEGLNGG